MSSYFIFNRLLYIIIPLRFFEKCYLMVNSLVNAYNEDGFKDLDFDNTQQLLIGKYGNQ